MNKDNRTISIVSPVYNNESTLVDLAQRVFKVAEKNYSNCEYIFVIDGSPDNSYNVLLNMANQDERIKIINFARNFGQHNAIMAGLAHCNNDHIFIIDADLEEPPEYLSNLKKKIDGEYEIAVGIRKNNSRSFFKSVTAKLYTKVFNLLSTYKIVGNTTNMRLLTKKYASFLNKFEEAPFIGGFCAWIGLPIALIEVEINQSKGSSYTFSKLLSHARIGIIGFSDRLIRLSLVFGVFISLMAFCYGIYSIISKILYGSAAGYTSIISLIIFLVGLTLIILGILGEYIIDLNKQTKNRPNYLIYNKINL